MLAVGYLSFRGLPVDMFPNITFPVVTVTTPYPGAGPAEIETLVSKVLEEEMSTVPGIKRLRSDSREGVSIVVAEFALETDVKYAEQQIKDRVASAKRKLPVDIKEPVIRRIDPADQPILTIAIDAPELRPDQLYELADTRVKPKIEQVNQVGLVDIIGGRKREVRIDLDQKKLKSYELSATMVANRLASSGQNVPVGKFSESGKENVFRTVGEFKSLKDIEQTIVNFLGNDVPVIVSQVGRVYDGLQDEKNRYFLNGSSGLSMNVFRQSGANTVKVANSVVAQLGKINEEFAAAGEKTRLSVVRDGSKMIRANLDDVKESIFLGIALTILVVYLFLGNFRSTVITGLALPNSLLGAFVLMAVAGFTVNVMTLLALSLAVGLLVDDAIVVRENIFRHIEMGDSPKEAALIGTKEVTMAVVATTLVVIAVFGPVGFLKGIVGQFFREFGLTICFAMAISLFDALTMAPMLSAYFAGKAHGAPGVGGPLLYRWTFGPLVRGFSRAQDLMEDWYEILLRIILRNRTNSSIALLVSFGIFVASSLILWKFVAKTFLSPQDFGEFVVGLDLPPGTSLDEMNRVASDVEKLVRSKPEVALTSMTVGNRDGQSNVSEIFVNLVPARKRKVNTTQFKEYLREELKPFAAANPLVKDLDIVAGGQRPFNVSIIGSDLKQLEQISQSLFERLKDHPALKDVEISYRPGKPEVQFVVDRQKAERLGVSTNLVGLELRTLVEGATPAVFRQNGQEYDIRVRLSEEERNLPKAFETTFVPNINMTLLRLSDVAQMVKTEGPATISRQDRGRSINIGADIAADGPGMNAAIVDINKLLAGELKLPEGMRYNYVGQAESFKELFENMVLALTLAILFIYFVLASLYESFVTPFAIMVVLPLAVAGAFFALFVTRKALDLNSAIGCILLIGIASKNSILLVDYANERVKEGVDRTQAILEAGRARLRPILMTTVALIAGMLPIAIGLNEASRQRTSMGVAIIGGLISSTVLSLVVVPAAYGFIDRFRVWSAAWMKARFAAR
jgi:HAE1 family hydrophobic/amphiphilic exporter-1